MAHHPIQKMGKLFIALYALMMLVMVGSLGMAMRQNWQLKLESARSEIARQASIGNFLVTNAIAQATQSLAIARRALSLGLAQGPLSAPQAQIILKTALDDFNAYSNTTSPGVLLLLDRRGQLQARSDQLPAEPIELSDRAYFQRLSQNPDLEHTIGPLVKARTTGEWVFHVAIALKDESGRFQGVLSQQIRCADIDKDLGKYIDLSPSVQMVTQSSAGASFVHPLSLLESASSADGIVTPYADHARRSISPQDTFTWPLDSDAPQPPLLIGYEHSNLFNLLTTVALPLSQVRADFALENLALLGTAGIALFLISAIFVHLYRTSNRLSEAVHEAYSDTLTQLPNRRAFDDIFPRLLRDASRSAQPLSVLFIDIDHFKLFNDDYGHDGGDIALQAVAHTLFGCVTRPLDFVCRWGGEEFVVVLPHTPEASAVLLAQKIMAAVQALRLTDPQGQPMRQMTVSIGISSARVTSNQQGIEMVNEADEAMQQAKRAGRNGHSVHPRPSP